MHKTITTIISKKEFLSKTSIECKTRGEVQSQRQNQQLTEIPNILQSSRCCEIKCFHIVRNDF